MAKSKALTAFIAAVLLASAAIWIVRAQTPNQAALVVQYQGQVVSTYCITFAEPDISGLDLLLRAGLDIVYSPSGGMGAMVCKIGEQGCDNPANCLCQCRGANCVYWSYWHQIDGLWQYSTIGASNYRVKPGAVEGWTWGAGSISSAPRPPESRFEEICRAATPTSPATNTPPATETPPPTETPWPTDTPRPMDTPEPTATPGPPTQTPAATRTQQPITMPSLTHTQTPTIIPSVTAAAPTLTPAAPTTVTATTASEQVPAVTRSSWANYGLFAVLMAVLGAIALLVRKRG